MGTSMRNGAIVSAIVTVIIGSTIIYWLVYNGDDESVCKTKECINTAVRVLTRMDTSADPCEEFYRYACGGWQQRNPIPDDKADMTQFGVVRDRNNKAMHDILDTDYSEDRPAVRKTKKLYQMCMDEDTIKELGAQPALDLIQSLGGMPLLGDSFDKKKFNLESVLAQTSRGRSTPLISILVDADDKNSSRNIVKLDQPSLAMSGRDYYLKPELNSSLLAYREYMKNFLKTIWKSKDQLANITTFNDKKLKSAVNEIIELETDLARILEPKAATLNILAKYRKFKLKEMSQEVTKKFDWHRFVKKVLDKVDIKVQPGDKVISYGTKYFNKFEQVLKKHGERVIKNYLVWMSLHNSVSFLSKTLRDTQAVYRKAAYGTSQEQERWKTCASYANALFPMPTGALYLKAMFSEKSKTVMKEMVFHVIEHFKKLLPSLSWMDEDTLKAALLVEDRFQAKPVLQKKVDSIKKLLAYPDYIVDDDDPRLDDEYKDADIIEGNYFASVDDVSSFLFEYNLRKLVKPVDREEWSLAPAEVNAFYNTHKNLIEFPAAILQYPFFGPGHTYAMNYGAIGSAIAHEITHGFDTRGSRFDGEGNLENWWSNYSRLDFEERAQCIRDQYSGFFYDNAGMFINGNLTIGENIADIAGIRLTFGAYQLWKETHANKEFKLPGLEKFTPEQLLFIANGQVWCASERPEKAKKRITTGYHSPSQFRVEGSDMNFDEFGKTFGCTQGKHKLYPAAEDTCRVW